MKRFLSFILLIAILYCPIIFADLEGFGSTSSFGFGQTVYRVTNLNLSGATVEAMPIYDETGTLIGYIPVYATEW